MRMTLLLTAFALSCQPKGELVLDAPAVVYAPRSKTSWYRDRREILNSTTTPRVQGQMLRQLNKAWGYGEFYGLKQDSGGDWIPATTTEILGVEGMIGEFTIVPEEKPDVGE